MSAEALGSELLGGVIEEGLDELLHSLRELETAKKATLGIEALDAILDVFQNPPLTRQQQQFHHAQWSTQHQTPLAKEKPLPVIEITGATACSGKTQLLYRLVAFALLPARFNISGKESAVVLFDLSCKFSILRLHDIMKHIISLSFTDTVPKFLEHEISSIISDSLLHLHVFRPQSSASFLATLNILPSYLFAQPSTHFSSNRPLGLLAINDLGSFLWQDRLDADEEASIQTNNPAEKANNNHLTQHYRALVQSFREIQHRFACTIVATNWALSPLSSVAGHRTLRPSLPSVWHSFCAFNLVVERDRVKKFGPGMSVEEASKDAPQRWEAVKKSGCSAWINWWGSERWREEVREGVRSLEMGGGFSFRVTERGVEFGNDEE